MKLKCSSCVSVRCDQHCRCSCHTENFIRDCECAYFKNENGMGGDCDKEHNGEAIFREDIGACFCNFHYERVREHFQ